MIELGIVLTTVVVFAAVSLVIGNVPLMSVIVFSVWLIVIGMAIGVPAGVGYHVAMHRGLRASKVNAPAWWWSPVRYHTQLDARSYRRVVPWFFAGVFGAGLSLAGCGLILMCYFRLPSSAP